MQKRNLYLILGVLCLLASFGLFVYGRVIRPIIAGPQSTLVVEQNPPGAVNEQPSPTPQPRTERHKKSSTPTPQRSPRAFPSARPTQEPQTYTPPPVIARERPSYSPPAASAPTPQLLPPEQCAARIRSLRGRGCAFLPMECQQQCFMHERQRQIEAPPRPRRMRGREPTSNEKDDETEQTTEAIIQEMRKRRRY